MALGTAFNIIAGVLADLGILSAAKIYERMKVSEIGMQALVMHDPTSRVQLHSMISD